MPNRSLPRALVALALLTAASGCGGDSGGATGPSTPAAGMLRVDLAGPLPRVGAVLLTITGPAVPTGVEASQPGVVAHLRAVSGGASVALFGAIAPGELLRMRVPDTRAAGAYAVTVREVAGEDNALRDESAYHGSVASISR